MILLDIEKLLIEQEITLPIFIGTLPASPNSLIALFISGGYDGEVWVEEPTFQVRVRHTDYLEGYKTIEKIKDILLNIGNYGNEVRTYKGFFNLGDIHALGRDDNDRVGFSANFRTYLVREPYVPINECTEHIETINELNSQIIQKDNTIIEKNGTISNLEQSVEEKDYIITSLEQNVMLKDTTIMSLQEEVSGKNNTITSLQELIEELKAGNNTSNCKKRVLIDFGTESLKTELPGWNNLTDYISGQIPDLVDELGNPTGIGLQVYSPFDGIGINNYGEDYFGFYHSNTIQDGFYNKNKSGTLVLTGLDVNKYYRVTLFSSSDGISLDANIGVNTEPTVYSTSHYSRVRIPTKDNIGTTASRTIQPSINGEIYIVCKNSSLEQILNSLEVEEIEPYAL